MQAIPEDAAQDAFSYMTPMGYMSSSTCGYCRRSGNGQSQKHRRSYYTKSLSMSAACYQALIDRSWRRSGTLLYRPNQRDSCCPHYTLRIDSTRFRPTKDQRQAINRFNRFVVGDAYTKEAARRYPKSREQARKRDTEFNLAERVHESESQLLKTPPEPAHSFDVTLESDDFTEEKYMVYENYQKTVHQEPKEEITRSGFSKFLCNSPLKRETIKAADGREKRLGSYHMCYRLDGRLVAIGVLDLLPHAVSAVYFLYDESIHDWSPGKLGALREISLALEGNYRWWYPGFYIHTCPKMRYKMDYSPQQILNPSTMEWVEVSDEILARFDEHGYLDFPSTVNDQVTEPEQNQAGGAVDVEEQADGESSEEDSNGPYISLLTSNMPGLPPIDDLLSFDYDNIPVRLRAGIFPAVDVFQWQDEQEDIRRGPGPRGQLAQMAAAVGLDLMPQLCLDIRRF
ncbi:arginine-tRNA-protein transferase [Xylaria arbuscula]|nr:arginine-tRNA-protein transferase [Xylaria arbuscula]